MDDGRAGRRAAAYWFIDGLPEIVFGILYFAWGGIGLVWGFSLQNPWMKWATLAAFPIFLLVYWNDLKILDFCKARMTYPRTGFVSPPAEPPQDRDEIVTLRTAPPIERNVTSFRRRTVSVFFAATAAVDATRDIPIMAGRWGVPIARVVVAAVV